MKEITILDSQEGPVRLEPGISYKLINPDGDDIGQFLISGTPLTPGAFNKEVHLISVPDTGQSLFIDVNHGGGALTKIENRGTETIHAFTVRHPDILQDKEVFKMFASVIKQPKPFTVIWSYYDEVEEVDIEVIVSVRPLPREHAIEISYTSE